MLIQHTPNLTHRKIFAFWERFANDRHRPTFDLHQKVQKSPKNWEVQVGAPHIHTLRM